MLDSYRKGILRNNDSADTQSKIDKLKKLIDDVNAETELYNKRIKAFEKQLLEEHGVSINLQKADSCGLTCNLELKKKDHKTGELMEHRIIEGDKEKIIFKKK